MYWLHGRGQNESRDQYPPEILDKAIRDGAAPAMIVVYASGGQRTHWSDSFDGKIPAETMVVTELIPHVDSTYRTVPGRQGRAIAGMSMGGGGALKFAFKYPELFSSVTAFAPALRTPENFAKNKSDVFDRMFAGDPARYAAVHPETLVRANADQIRGTVGVAIVIGDRDELLPFSRSLKRVMANLKVDLAYDEVPTVAHDLPKLARHADRRPFEFAAKWFAPDR